MIPVKRPDLADVKWISWHDRARQAIASLVSKYRPRDEVTLQDELYQEAKPFLIELFHGKCAYCEALIAPNQPGDVEHYRPKGRIRDRAGKVLKVPIGGAEVEHPGYWWLAYDWRNLLPSCADCNRRRWHADDTFAAGKAEFFEVRGKRAVLPTDDLSQEQPLLLDPSADGFDPKQHFEYMEDGTIKPISDEARYSCELLGLNLREKLVDKRGQVYLEAKQAFVFLLGQAVTATPEALKRVRRQINDMWEGRNEYSAFARQSLEAARTIVQQNTGLRVELPLQ